MHTKPYTSEQRDLIIRGDELTQDLTVKVKHALWVTKLKHLPRHSYIHSSPGAGKTWTVQFVADKYNIQLLKIQGVATLSSIVNMLALAVDSLDPNEILSVWIDDCDSLFMDRDSLNVMKGVLDEDRNILSYHKNLTSQIMTWEKSTAPGDLAKAKALRRFQPNGMVGVEIPTDQLRFIITSNKPLTTESEVAKLGGKLTLAKVNEGAIRDRINYTTYKLTDKMSWGWVASLTQNNNVFDLDALQKRELLEFMWVHLGDLSSLSLRKVRELAAAMINFPDKYPDHWENSLITNG